MKLAYAKKVSEEIHEISIVGEIGEVVNGDYIAADIAFINRNKLASQINLRINTEGGNVISGFKIIGAVLNSSIPVHTYNDGIAYSMGFELWLSAKKENRHASFFASWMAHAARFIGEDDNIIEPENEDDTAFLNVINNSMSEFTSEASGKTKQDILKMFEKDTFFTPDEMVKNGFLNASNIIKYSSMPQFQSTMSIQEKIKTIAAFYTDKNNNTNKTNNTYNMDLKALATEMKLNPEASIDAIVANYKSVVSDKEKAVNEVKTLQDEQKTNLTAIKDLEKNNKDLEAKLKTHEEKEKELKKEAIKAKVDKAVEEGKFKEEDKDELTAMAVKNPEMFEKIVSMAQVQLNVKAPDITAHLKGDKFSEMAAKIGVDVKNMNFDYLWKNEPDKLEEIKAESPKLYEAMERMWIDNA